MSLNNPRPPDPPQTPETVVLPSSALDGSIIEKPSPDAPTFVFDAEAKTAAHGPTVPGYEILSELGRGGMGVVYKARQKNPQRVVALKCILAGQLASPADVQRFRNEADAAAQMSHPGLIPIYEVGEHGGQHYFSMKLIDGGNLAEALADGRWKTVGPERHRAAARLVADAARAVHYAHQCGIIHRDLKPANVLLEDNGTALVTDFGLAKRFQGHEALTRSNVIMGTPAYMSPEQATGAGGLTTAADTYSLGAILYELLTGRPPFQGETPLSVVLQLREMKPPPPRSLDRSIDRDLETICLKCLEKEPGQRYRSAEALADDLERWLNGDMILARRAGRLEWTWKWVRRHPAQALLGLLAFLVLALSLGAVGLFWRLGELEEQRRKVALYAQEKDEAYAEALRGQEEARKNAAIAQQARKQVEAALYSNGIARAHFEVLGNDVSRADQVLEECPEPLRDWEWYYLKRLCHPDLMTINAHDNPMTCAAVSTDGKLLATSSQDRTVKVWDALTGQEKVTLSGQKQTVTWVAFSPDSKYLAGSSMDRSVIVWDLNTNKQAHRLEGHTGGVWRVVYSADGKSLATAGLDMTVRVWDAETGTENLTLRKHTKGITGVAFSPDGARLASASYDTTVRIWDLASGAEIQSLKGHAEPVLSVVFSTDGKRVATGSADKTAVVWDIESGQQLHTYRGSANSVGAVAFSPDDRLLAGGCNDRTVRVWDVNTGQERFNFTGHTGEVNSVAFTTDGGRLVTGSSDKTLKVWEVATHQESYALATGQLGPVSALAFSPVGRQLASGALSDRVIKVWDPATGRELFRLEGHRNGVTSLAYRADGKRLASASVDGSIKIWDMEKRQEVVSPKGHAIGVLGIAFSPDGTRLATSSSDRMVKIWDAETGKEVATLRGHNAPVTSVAFSPDGKRLVSGGLDRTAKVWEVEKQSVLHTYKGHNGAVSAVAFSPDGKRVASNSWWDAMVKVWNPENGETVFALKGHVSNVDCLAFSPDGNRLATGSAVDQTVKVWDVLTGHETLTLKGHTGGVRCVAFSRDGHLLASGSMDHTIRIWNGTPLPPRVSPWLSGPTQ
jgi:WD40 repeat protein/tRNA A-37 threonylcarbamoyl transferase component Bud32